MLRQRIWLNKQNRRKFFDYIASQLGITDMSQWYGVTTAQVKEFGAQSLLYRFYRTSLPLAVMDLYPEHNARLLSLTRRDLSDIANAIIFLLLIPQWIPWYFDQLPYQFWKDKANLRRYFEWLAPRLNFHNIPEDFYKLQLGHLRANYGATIVSSFNHSSLMNALEFAFPGRWKNGPLTLFFPN